VAQNYPNFDFMKKNRRKKVFKAVKTAAKHKGFILTARFILKSPTVYTTNIIYIPVNDYKGKYSQY